MVGVAMVAPAICSNQEEKLAETNMNEGSPKRVADFEGHQNERSKPVEALMLGPLSFPSDHETPCLSKKNVPLPTLIETSSVSSSEAGDREERDDFLDDESELYISICPLESKREKQREKPPAVKTTTTKDEFMKLKTYAANLAARGREAEALKTYTRALRLMRSDLAKIKRSMKNALETTIASMQTQLYQAWVQVASEIAEIRTTMAILSERQGDYETAIKSCEEARIVYQSYANLKTKVKIGNDDEDDQLEQMEHMLERLALAKASYTERKLLHQEAAHVKSCLVSEVDPDVKERLYDELFNVLATVLEMEQDSLGKMHPQVADTIAMIAQVHADRRETAEALETMHSSVSIMRLTLGHLHPRTATALRDLARMYESKDSDRAIQVYEAAIEAFRGWGYGNYHAMVGSTLNNIAVIYIQRGDLDGAVEKLSDALAAYESGVEQGNAINPEVAQVWKNLGECYSLRKEWESALFAYTSALGVQQDARRCRDVLDSDSVDVSLDGPLVLEGADDSSFADTMLRLAKATAALGQYDEAVKIYEEALHIYRLMLHKATVEAEGHPSADMVEAQDRVAHTLYCIAETQEKNVQYDEAVALYTEAFDLRLRSDAVREHRRANMVHCAMCLAGIGSVHMHQHEYTDACLVLKESLHFLEAHGENTAPVTSSIVVVFPIFMSN
jgi:tetratricopeptide (TPR) repeat protein